MKEKKLLNISEACKLLPFWKKRSIQTMTSNGKIPHIKIGGRNFYYEDELISFAASLMSKGGSND